MRSPAGRQATAVMQLPSPAPQCPPWQLSPRFLMSGGAGACAGEPARFPDGYDFVIRKTRAGLARQFPDAAGWSGPGTVQGRDPCPGGWVRAPWPVPAPTVARVSSWAVVRNLPLPGVGAAGAAGHQAG